MVGGEKKYISLRVRCRVDFLFSTIFSWRFPLALLFGRLCNASQVQGYSRPLSFGHILSHVLLFAEFLGVNFFFFLQGCHVLLGQDFSFGCYCCCADFAFALLFRGVVAQKSNISERQLNASDSRLFTQNVEFVELEFLLFAKGSSLPAQPSPSHFAGGRWQLLVGFQNKKTGQTNVCCPFAAAQMFT